LLKVGVEVHETHTAAHRHSRRATMIGVMTWDMRDRVNMVPLPVKLRGTATR